MIKNITKLIPIIKIKNFPSKDIIIKDFKSYLSEKKSGSLTHQATKINTLSAFWQIFFFLCALLGAYSRIYLSQHFAEDIWGGVLIGLTVSLLFCSLLPLISDKKWYKIHFFEKKLQKNLEH